MKINDIIEKYKIGRLTSVCILSANIEKDLIGNNLSIDDYDLVYDSELIYDEEINLSLIDFPKEMKNVLKFLGIENTDLISPKGLKVNNMTTEQKFNLELGLQAIFNLPSNIRNIKMKYDLIRKNQDRYIHIKELNYNHYVSYADGMTGYSEISDCIEDISRKMEDYNNYGLRRRDSLISSINELGRALQYHRGMKFDLNQISKLYDTEDQGNFNTNLFNLLKEMCNYLEPGELLFLVNLKVTEQATKMIVTKTNEFGG